MSGKAEVVYRNDSPCIACCVHRGKEKNRRGTPSGASELLRVREFGGMDHENLEGTVNTRVCTLSTRSQAVQIYISNYSGQNGVPGFCKRLIIVLSLPSRPWLFFTRRERCSSRTKILSSISADRFWQSPMLKSTLCKTESDRSDDQSFNVSISKFTAARCWTVWCAVRILWTHKETSHHVKRRKCTHDRSRQVLDWVCFRHCVILIQVCRRHRKLRFAGWADGYRCY
jgi:hypothetical protein